jgi:metal-sulfur cluster biosynthetic enzyme
VSELNQADVVRALRTVVDPCSIATGRPVDLVDMGLVQKVDVDDSAVTVVLQLTSPFCFQVGMMAERMESAVLEHTQARSVTVKIDHHAEWMPSMMSESARRSLRLIRPGPSLTTQATPADGRSGDPR